MASKKVNVAVYDGDRLVTKLAARPVRLMPDGYAGVVYNAAVYPLYADDCINLADEPVDKDDCDRFVPAYKDTPYTPEDRPYGGDDDAGHLGIEAWYLEATSSATTSFSMPPRRPRGGSSTRSSRMVSESDAGTRVPAQPTMVSSTTGSSGWASQARVRSAFAGWRIYWWTNRFSRMTA